MEQWKTWFHQIWRPDASRPIPWVKRDNAYTAEEDKIIIHMRSEGSTFRRISETTDRPEASLVKRWCEWLDDRPLARRNRSREPQMQDGNVQNIATKGQEEQMRIKIASGESVYDIALALGLSMDTVVRYRAKSRRLELLDAAP